MSVGPIQLIAFGFEDFEPHGEILRELTTQIDAGVIRLIDAQIVRKDRFGRITRTAITGLSRAEAEEFGAVIGRLMGRSGVPDESRKGSLAGTIATLESSFGLGTQEIQNIATDLLPGGAAAVLVIEHTWATGFSAAVQRASGTVLAQGFLTRDALLMVGGELEAQAKAAKAVRAANQTKITAAREAARAVALSDAVMARAVQEAVRALADARLVKEAAVGEAAMVVAAAFAIEEAAVQDAVEAVAEADDIVAEATAEAEVAVYKAEATVADAELIADEAVEKAKEERAKRPTISAHELSYIEGIGPTHREQLKQAGIGNTMELLEKGATPSGRHAIARETGISKKLILTWINHADLFRIRGIGPEYAELLEAAGVDTVVELAARNPSNLHNKLVSENEEKHLVRQIPSEAQIEEWVDRAKAMPRVITY